MIFTFVILLSDCEHKHVLYDNSLINHMFGGGSVNISVLITNHEPVLSKVVYENDLCCTESVFAFAVCQLHLLDSLALING